MSKVGILGAGTWGIALSRMLANTGHTVTVWSALPDEVKQLDQTRQQKNLPGMTIPASITFTSDLPAACTDQALLLLAVPSVYVRSTVKQAAPFIPAGQLIVDVAKGLEPDTMLTMTQVIADELSQLHAPKMRLVALSGPTHAEEVALDLPTTIVAAADDEEAAKQAQDIFTSSFMRVYTNPDRYGVELCGALKNIIALAAGISDGLGYGDNGKAALITRGMTEIKRLGTKLGAHAATFDGLAGIGDLIVTGTSTHSRNHNCGLLIGQGMSPAAAKKQIGMVVEGINAIPGALELAAKANVSMPIVETVDQVINHGLDPKEAVQQLLNRKKKAEF